MNIHKEGYKIIAWSTIIFGLINILSFYFLSFKFPVITWIIFAGTLGLLLFVISFFRIPKRAYNVSDDTIVAPADGKISAS